MTIAAVKAVHDVQDAFEDVSFEGPALPPFFLSCEHASERLPEPFRLAGTDARLAGTHWAFDLGARELSLELAQAVGARAVLSRFSRLVVDPNRPLDHPDLFRARADGEPVLLNESLTGSDRERRLLGYYQPFHEAVDRALAARAVPLLLSIHTFSPVYEGRRRSVAVGVLYNHEERLARRLGQALSAELADVAYNEPWSGREGLMYSPERHAEAAGIAPLELEVRQDLATNSRFRARLIEVLVQCFGGGGARRPGP